jgi:hypothetical protein
MESIASHEDFGIDQKGLLKQESGDIVLDLVDYPVKAPGQSTELYNDEHDGTKSTKRMQDEGCEYDFYQRDSRAYVKTHIWASPTSVAAPKSQILIEQSIFQYFVHADTVDEGFWDGNDDSDQFLKQYTLQPLFDEHDFKLEGKYGGVGKWVVSPMMTQITKLLKSTPKLRKSRWNYLKVSGGYQIGPANADSVAMMLVDTVPIERAALEVRIPISARPTKAIVKPAFIKICLVPLVEKRRVWDNPADQFWIVRGGGWWTGSWKSFGGSSATLYSQILKVLLEVVP